MTTVLPAENHRVHPVDAAQMPPEEVARPDLLNPQLRRGDMLLMQGFTWHFADANQPPSTGRSGMYMKFRAASSPAATGPLLFSSAVAAGLAHPRIMPYTRADGTQTVDTARLVLEHSSGDGSVWAVREPSDGGWRWRLPSFAIEPFEAMRSETTSAWDASNVIGEVQEMAREELGLELPWLSWIADEKAQSGSAAEQLCRVYGHVLGEGAPLPSAAGEFVPAEKLPAEEAEQVRCWVDSVDGRGRAVRRGYGVARDMGGAIEQLKETGAASGGTFRVGEFPLPA